MRLARLEIERIIKELEKFPDGGIVGILFTGEAESVCKKTAKGVRDEETGDLFPYFRILLGWGVSGHLRLESSTFRSRYGLSGFGDSPVWAPKNRAMEILLDLKGAVAGHGCHEEIASYDCGFPGSEFVFTKRKLPGRKKSEFITEDGISLLRDLDEYGGEEPVTVEFEGVEVLCSYREAWAFGLEGAIVQREKRTGGRLLR